ncbi:MAG: HigA family addiction module antidote protein [Rhodospirillales bacterium]|nr:MAG: HigA family addiction module antidote protein [Rhodospirillales bacterium]
MTWIPRFARDDRFAVQSTALKTTRGTPFVKTTTTRRRLPPPHPGEVLALDFLGPLALSKYRLARATGMAATRIGEICAGRRGVTADTALRLGRALGTTPQFWMNLQAAYDLDLATDALGKTLERRVERLVAA